VRHAAWAAAVFAGALAARQAPQIPHVGYVYPAGGRRGSSVEVRVGGQFLNGAKTAYVSGQGVRAIVTQYVKPLTGAESQKLREEMKDLREKREASRKKPAPGAATVAFTRPTRSAWPNCRTRSTS
jgi:hypothetical protein